MVRCQGSPRFRFVIVPTVLAELDELKRTRSAQSVGEKAEKAIRIIKGLRKQGSVLDGVMVAKTITVAGRYSGPEDGFCPEPLKLGFRRSYPEQDETGNLGYFGNSRSVTERVHR